MTSRFLAFAAALILLLAAAPAAAGPPVSFTILRTGGVRPPEALTFAGGRLLARTDIVHAAVLIRHGDDSLLLDTGLGRNIDRQFATDEPWWAKPLFGYQRGVAAANQLKQAGLPSPPLIVLSHAHWDHASGLEDFSDARIIAGEAEPAFARQVHRGAVFPSQFPTVDGRWRTARFDGPPLGEYGPTADLYGDGSVRLVRMPGHTPGSLGLLLTTETGRRFFFVGDTVWRSEAIQRGAPKFWLASRILDNDRAGTLEQIRRLGRFHKAFPDVTLLPAHDGTALGRLGYFPIWTR